MLDRLVDAAHAHVHDDLAFVSHSDIANRSFRDGRVGWHADALLRKHHTPPAEGI